jgi:hypothetical protein
MAIHDIAALSSDRIEPGIYDVEVEIDGGHYWITCEVTDKRFDAPEASQSWCGGGRYLDEVDYEILSAERSGEPAQLSNAVRSAIWWPVHNELLAAVASDLEEAR